MNQVITLRKCTGCSRYIFSSLLRPATLFYCSGQLGIDPSTGELPNSVEAQVRQAFQKCFSQSLRAAGGKPLRDIVRQTVYLTDLANFAVVANKSHGRSFQGSLIRQEAAYKFLLCLKAD